MLSYSYKACRNYDIALYLTLPLGQFLFFKVTFCLANHAEIKLKCKEGNVIDMHKLLDKKCGLL